MSKQPRKPAVFSDLRTAMEAAELVRHGASRGFSVMFSPDSTCVNASRDESFICTAGYNTLSENMAQVLAFVNEADRARKAAGDHA